MDDWQIFLRKKDEEFDRNLKRNYDKWQKRLKAYREKDDERCKVEWEKAVKK